MSSRSANSPAATRREFLKGTSTAVLSGALAGSLAWPRGVHAAGSDELRIGLIGCGGRGTGAAAQALAADPRSKLTAMGDAFADQVESSWKNLSASPEFASRIDVPPERRFAGFQAYQQVIDSGVDVVLLASTPHFRPAHLQAAVAAGKHVFAEKPVAVDAPGVRSVLASGEEARKKNLSIVSGLCYRYDLPKRETIKRIHDGAIGEVLAMQVNYLTGTLWHRGRKPEWSEMEYQMRNWMYFTWLSGDFNVEQHVHSLDKAAWIMHDEPPVKATGLGGRQVRVEEQWGHIFDHMAVVYEYANGTKLFSNCRQMAGCAADVSDHVIGSAGTAELMSATIKGQDRFRYRGPTPNMYDVEHQELFASIRSGVPINNALFMARSTMMAIMGRMACYTGQSLTWDQCFNSTEDLTPARYEWGPLPTPPVAKPGLTPFA